MLPISLFLLGMRSSKRHILIDIERQILFHHFVLMMLQSLKLGDQCIDGLVALLCNYNLLENTHNVEEIWDQIMECVNADANE